MTQFLPKNWPEIELPAITSKRVLPCRDRAILFEGGRPVLFNWGARAEQAQRCADCGYIFFDTPEAQALADYYQNEYPANAASWYNAANDYDRDGTARGAKAVLETAARYLGDSNVAYHESGCAFGGTVARLNEMGFDATGTDLNAGAIAEGRQRGCDRLFAEYEKDYFERSGRQVDVLVSSHSMEHMPDPVQFLKDVRPYLRGIMIVRVPNSVSFLVAQEGFRSNSWFAYPDHLHMLSPRSLLCLAERSGYAVLDMYTSGVAPSPEQSAALLAKYSVTEKDIQRLYLGLELAFTLTPADSPVAERFARAIEETAARCRASGKNECGILDAGSP